jgi:hypothetical protein
LKKTTQPFRRFGVKLGKRTKIPRNPLNGGL